MQENTLEELVKGYYYSQEFDANHDEEEMEMWVDFITFREEKAREEGRKEGLKVIKNNIVEEVCKEAITQYKEELLGKLPEIMRPDFTKVTSLTAKRRMTVRANGFNSCLSEVKKLL